ncbi:pentapeptide repeat-containing protein [Peptostreptococcus porci]|uniref:pentapeptide repeat-containing protein n=1 Tax=Peptostreptococcus porci TaxID=2652282 RepID=UPI002A747358|nr:pentapeptide repeat-containing protein [Peptostreptococcus porci]MDY2794238.1 pentapeptide repeat-containing protein [Peptostreptococcus porci]MDY4129213.1 pentapeptide repeat-containing protein [Peptostreptococcus porci]
MKKVSKNELIEMLANRKNCAKDLYFFNEIIIEDEDLSDMDLSGIDFSWSDFKNVNFERCNMSKTIFNHSKFTDSNLKEARLDFASLFGVDLRGCNMENTYCDGVDFTEALLVGAKLDGLKYTENTIHFDIHCPKEGYFFGYKKCFNDRMVKLLIPKDAKRCSSTTTACRCDKAKVVEITDIERKICFDEAVSFVDENFIYRLGEMVYADSYHEDRWLDSSHGIHFWMTFEEALGYM